MVRNRARPIFRKAKNQLSLNSLAYAAMGSFGAPRTLRNLVRYGESAPRFAQKFVLPTNLIAFLGAPARRKDSARVVFHDGSIVGIETTQLYADLYARFCDEQPWVSTGYVSRWEQTLQEVGPIDSMSRRDHIYRRCERLDGLWAQMNSEGSFRVGRNPLYWNGIRVNVLSDGTFAHAREGTHRVALAKLGRIPHVPVEIGFVHSDMADSFQGLVEQAEKQAGATLSSYLALER